jgi:hypothetical protein
MTMKKMIVAGKMIRKVFFLSIILVMFFYSCNSGECKNTNPIFNKYSPVENDYKVELAHQIQLAVQNKVGVNYFFEKLVKDGDSLFLHCKVKSENICAIMVMEVSKPNELLSRIIEKNGMGYRGAGLTGLNYVTINAGGLKGVKTRFIFFTLTGIID